MPARCDAAWTSRAPTPSPGGFTAPAALGLREDRPVLSNGPHEAHALLAPAHRHVADAEAALLDPA